MPPGQRFLIRVMWVSGGLAAALAIACMVIANFFFPTADQTPYFDALAQQPNPGTYFHPGEAWAIRAWKVCLMLSGISVALVMLAAFVYGLFYPPPQNMAENGAPSSS